MRSRLVWFAVGTTAGVYSSFKARRIAYRLTPAGLSDQAGALGVGLRAFGAEVRAGMAEREAQIADELGLTAPSSTSPARATPELETLDQKDIT